MKESFWKRKGVKTAFVWMIFDFLLLAVFFYGVFSRGFEEANWLLLLIAAMNTDRIIVPLADLSEPPGIFTFFTGVIPAGVFMAYFVSLREGTAEGQNMLLMILLITLLLWNGANIGWGIWEKKKKTG